MKKCLVFTSLVDGLSRMNPIRRSDYDLIITADGGLKIADYFRIEPDLLIGDYDSCEQPKDREVIKLPTRKDMTDSEAAVDLAVQKGAEDITMVGGLGGRFDHTMGNLGLLAKYSASLPGRFQIIDGFNRIFLADPGSVTVKKDGYHYLGIAAYDSPVTGLTLQGTAYPLSDYTLDNRTTLGASNEIPGKEAVITFRSGRLLIIQSNEA
ncbi:MAG: thiamine diphosphokinase [Eubacteriales bacterium]|nr:thiamine diphosphokinase [Eubacteriales bacterium]